MATNANDEQAPDWLLRDKHVIEGLDQLRIQVVSVQIYRTLLPGLTNVTDRARYFTFFPWVLHRFAQRGETSSSRATWHRWNREFEYGYALACAIAEADAAEAGTAVIGVDAARSAVRSEEDEVFDIRGPARVDENGSAPKTGSYFANSQGGFGQYYKVPLSELGIMLQNSETRYPDRALTNDTGAVLAKDLDSSAAFQGLAKMITKGSATRRELRKIASAVAPNSIPAGGREETILRDVMLGRTPEARRNQNPDAIAARRDSLLLMIDFMSEKRQEKNQDVAFRWACFEGVRSDGSTWTPRAKLDAVRRRWALYQTNELLNFALETLFWAALEELDQSAHPPADLASLILERAIKAAAKDRRALKTGTVADFALGETAPARQTVAEVVEAIDAGSVGTAASAAISLLRVVMKMQFSESGLPPGIASIFGNSEINVLAFQRRAAERLPEPAGDFFRDLLFEWVLARHLRVAVAKLASQGVSTFKFRPEEGALVRLVDKNVRPTFTSPRLRPAFRILTDIGFLDRTGAPSEDGISALDTL